MASVKRAKHATLVASTVDEVTFSSAGNTVRVANRSDTDELYFTLDGVDPTVGGDDTYFCAPGTSVTVLTGSKVVRLISDGTPDYSVELY